MNTLRQKFVILPGILLLGLYAACKTPAPVPAPVPAAMPEPAPVQAPIPTAAPLPPEEIDGDPQFMLVFDRIEAKSVGKISLFYTLQAKNPRPDVLPVDVRNWQVELNGGQPAISAMTAFPQEQPSLPQGWSAVPAGGITAAPGRPARGAHFEALPHDTGTLGFRLDLDLPADSNNFDEYNANLQVSLCWEYEGDDHSDTDLSAAAAFGSGCGQGTGSLPL
ncbi:hypothetical protein AGMMS49587_15880 [Spirochaetia bacterium]|nr:hypothetical protein AGMMS49587_15880 [Spirochaetia bacterium]